MQPKSPKPRTHRFSAKTAGRSRAKARLALPMLATLVLSAAAACSTESGGRKTPITGSPVPQATSPSRPATGTDSTQTQTQEQAQTQAAADSSGDQTGVGDPTNPGSAVASPGATATATAGPSADMGNGMAGPVVTASPTAVPQTTPTTAPTGGSTSTDCTTGKTVTGPRYTKSDLNLRSGPDVNASVLVVVPLHSEVTYYWTSGAYACVVWRGSKTHVGWLSTAYLQTARP